MQTGSGAGLAYALSRALMWTLCLAATFALGFATVGCAEERAPINRVQANALAKSFFVGTDIRDPGDDPEFYMRVTVVDAAAGAGNDGLFTASDAQPTTRVRFEIAEDLLIARLTYELVDNTDGKGVRRTADGQIAAAYTIASHFDIRREYNSDTGEEINVVVENETDRPWYEREYFRIDWSRNLVTTAYELDTMSQLGIFYGVTWEPITYYVNDPTHPDAPVFDAVNGYFDVTNKAWAQPQTYEDPWWGTTPVCWDYGQFPVVSCNPSEITLRQAFRKVGDTDYEPLDYDGTRMDMFGLFTVDRQGYDRRYGVVDQKWRRFASRWNIWQRSHAEPDAPCNTPETTPIGEDPHRDLDANGTEDECEIAGSGSRCDDIVGLCTLPYRERQVKTIPWHVNRDYPADLFAATKEQLDVWNDAVRVAVLSARLTECRRTGGGDCEAQMGWPVPWSDDYVPPVGNATLAEVPPIFVLCHNPVDPSLGDDASCGAVGTAPRLGDIRYNSINIINQFQQSSPWGIMMDAEDPLTGEKISGSVNMWGATLDRASATITDLLGLLNGTVDPTQYIEGEDISHWVEKNAFGPGAENPAHMSAAELHQRLSAYDPDALAPYLSGLHDKPGIHPKLRRQLRAQELVDRGRLGPGNAAIAERQERLRGTELEAKLISPEMAQLAGYDPTGATTADVIDHASPLGRNNPAVRRAKQHAMRLGQARRHGCRYEGPEPDNLLGLAKQAQQLFPAPDPADPAAVDEHRQQVYQWAREGFTRGVMAHEMGHSMGLRHNFAASWDSLNYGAGYWQLRTNNGTVTEDCAEGTTEGADCIGPRWRDPISDLEIDGNINQYATTSVMDYPGDQSQDMVLPGRYDKAAMRFAYGGTVDVWAGISVNAGDAGQAKAFKLTAFAASLGLDGARYFPPVDPLEPYLFIHYSQFQNEFQLIGECSASSDADAVAGMKCAEHPMDVVDYRDMSDFIDNPDYASFEWAYTSKATDPEGRVRRGYLFSSDEYADAGNVPTFTDDAGADAYEQVTFLSNLYENRYILDAFRRNRVTFNSQDTVWRIQGRYLDNIQQIAKTFAFIALLSTDPTAPDEEFTQDGLYGPLTLAGTKAFDLFARQLTRPEPGFYCTVDDCGGPYLFDVDVPFYVADPAPLPDIFPIYPFQIDLGTGRYVHNDFDYSQGYWWGDYQKQVGAYYDKIWAVYYLSEAFDYFISNAKEDFTDSRYKNVNFATVFPEQVRRLYSALMTNDYDTYAPWVDPPALAPGGVILGDLQYPNWWDPTDIGTRTASSVLTDPNYAWNEQIYAMVWGTIFFPTNWSYDFINDARIAALPTEQPSWPDAEIIKFQDPESGMLYAAHTNGTEVLFGKTRQKSVGARMLEWANVLTTYAYIVDRDVDGNAILDAYGMPTFLLDGDGQKQLDPANEGAAAVLHDYVANIDQMRQLVVYFMQPLDDDNLPQP
jgi:hypothetical protein